MGSHSLRLFCQYLSETTLSQLIQNSKWMIPLLQTIHILALAMVFSSALLVNMRIWRIFEADRPLSEIARRFVPVIWKVLFVLLITGALLIIAEPKRSLQNTSFYIKMALLAAALVCLALLQVSLRADPHFWEKTPLRRVVGRLAALGSTLIWCGILFAGRWIAYTQVG